MKILITLSTFCEYSEEPREILQRSGLAVVENQTGRRMTPEEVLASGTDWAGLVAGVEVYSAETLAQMPELRCISRVGVGTDSIDHDYANAHEITIRNTPDAPTLAVAEIAMAMMLGLLKHLPWHDQQMKSGKWKKRAGSLLNGKTVGIVGVGRIGRTLCGLLSPFGVNLLGADPVQDDAWAKDAGLTYCPLDELLKTADIISLHTSIAPTESALIGAHELSMVKEDAILINSARGNLIDADDLVNALRQGRLAGAALDVYSEEPYYGELCTLDNVLLTPHIATYTKETRVEMEVLAAKNLVQELNSAATDGDEK